MSARKKQERTNGLAAATLLAGGLGAFALGLMTILAEASASIKSALVLYPPAGPLSGKTTVAIGLWLGAWVVLVGMWKEKDVEFDRAARWAFVFLGLGLVATFPPVFELFAGG